MVSCGQKSNDSKKTVSSNLESSYKILSEKEEVIPDFGIYKCNIVVGLEKKLSNDELAEIANNLRKTRTKYDKLWISFYLNDTKLDGVAWAIANFTPDLKVEIIGTTEKEENELKKNAENVDGKIIGKFYENQYLSATCTVYENNGNTFIKMSFSDGSSSVTEMKTKELPNGTRLEDKEGNPHGEYYVLSKKGELEFYNSENKMFTTAKKIE
jgi:hypothetical protein